MNTLSLLVSPVGLAALPTVTKSVGSFFRYNVDYRNAPEEDKRNEYKREVSLLSLAFLSNLGVQLLAARHLPKILAKTVPSLAKNPANMQAANLLGRFALTIPGTVIAETLSRVIGKPPTWDHAKADDDADETRYNTQPTYAAEREADDDRYETRQPYAESERYDDDRPDYEEKPAPVFSHLPSLPTLPQAVFNPFASAKIPMQGTLTPSFMYHGSQDAPQQPAFTPFPTNALAPRNF